MEKIGVRHGIWSPLALVAYACVAAFDSRCQIRDVEVTVSRSLCWGRGVLIAVFESRCRSPGSTMLALNKSYFINI